MAEKIIHNWGKSPNLKVYGWFMAGKIIYKWKFPIATDAVEMVTSEQILGPGFLKTPAVWRLDCQQAGPIEIIETCHASHGKT
jgi:hypothetical protein